MLTLVWTVEQMHLPADLGVKGLNSINLLVAGCVVMVLRQRFPTSEPTPIKWAFVLFFVMLVWAFAAGQLRDRSLMMDDLTALKNGIFFMLLYFVFFHGVRDERTVHYVFLSILGVSVLVALEAIREGMDYGFGVYSETKRSAGPFGDDYRASNLLAVYLAMFTPPFIGVALYAKKHPWIRAAALGGLVLMVLATFCTYSRQAYGIMAFTLLAMTMRRNLVLGAVILVALLNYEAWVPAGVVDRIAMTEQVGETGEAKLDESTASRFELWDAAGQMLQGNPGGIGLNHFKREIGEYDARLAGKDAHNFVVLITAEGGYLGFIAIMSLYAALLWLAWSLLRVADTPESKAIAIGFMVSTLTLILGNLYGSRVLDGAVTGAYWVYAALAARYRILIETGQRHVPAMGSAPVPAAVPAAVLASMPATVSAAVPGTGRGPASRDAASRDPAGRDPAGRRLRDRDGRLVPLDAPVAVRR